MVIWLELRIHMLEVNPVVQMQDSNTHPAVELIGNDLVLLVIERGCDVVLLVRVASTFVSSMTGNK